MNAASHDPGGKVTLPLAQGVEGDAAFSPCGRYRHALLRERTGLLSSNSTALFIGMNPSTAGAEVDDPTCRREQARAWSEGVRFYVKVNVMDYRATDPRDLRREGVQPRSDTNLDWIRRMAENAREDGGFAVAAWGMLHPSLQRYAGDALAVLRLAGVPLRCLGYTRAGHPRHPLYLPANAPWRPFPRGDA